ncbi:MAG: Cytochrome c family protein [Desulfonauticus sp. 38_4375]|nr:MAG: Cytochrome c family protein [Desulfonauticus sp. 38_4375]
MTYPVWELGFAGGGLLIALIGIFHVYIAHFAVGGGVFLALTEKKAIALNSPSLLEYTRKHALFFLLLTMVAGGVTGVGIWFTISLLQPAATSFLIHHFVFFWATEWVFFLAEIIVLLLYYYGFKKLDSQKHILLAWFYFLFAWASLFFISGIIDFMLTPGKWLQSKNLWDGFFNPSFWPSIFFRTFLALSIASIFGLVTASFKLKNEERVRMSRYYAKYIVFFTILTFLAGVWYYNILDQGLKNYIFKLTPYYKNILDWFFYLTPLIIIVSCFYFSRLNGSFQKTLSLIMLILGIIYIGSFEFLREGARKPFIIYDYMYSNGIKVQDLEEVNKTGILALNSYWLDKDRANNNLYLGKEIFKLECSSCHSRGGPLRDILKLTQKYDNPFGLVSQLTGQGKILKYMPPFSGTEREKKLLAEYIIYGLQKKEKEIGEKLELKPVELSLPPFAEDQSEYVLLAWNNLGMHCISDSWPYWVLLPPANDLFALVIKRGELPEVVTEGIEVVYEVEEGFRHPEEEVEFWQVAPKLFGKKLAPGEGLSGNRVVGKMKLEEETGIFGADLIPVVPYSKKGFNPYPQFTIKAVDKESGKILATTKVIAPTSTEMGCKNCHGGPWRKKEGAGISEETAQDVLRVHDRINNTTLLKEAKEGRPVLCQSCHPDPVLKAKGKPHLPNLPAAIHGWHANYLSGRGSEACFQCHPASLAGSTGCLRGIHAARGLDCTSCHGYLEDHALSLLRFEKSKGKAVEKLMLNLKPRKVDSLEKIKPREPWLNEPDCFTCHQNYEKPVKKEGFNAWTKNAQALYRHSFDESGVLPCIGCHGSPHAIYPAKNIYEQDLDNIQPLQYQKNRRAIGAGLNCKVCHLIDMEDEMHHVNMLRP